MIACNLFDQLGGVASLAGARCRGRHALFDEAEPHEPPERVDQRHAQALALCRDCPALASCQQWFAGLKPTQKPARCDRRTNPPTETTEGRKAEKGSVLMDPNTALENMRAAFVALGKRPIGDPDYVDELLTIAESALVLDDWITRGGFLSAPGLETVKGRAERCAADPVAAQLRWYLDGLTGDYRRAAAIVTHYNRQDADGLRAVMDEAQGESRGAELMMAILGLYAQLLPRLTDDDVTGQIQGLALQWAAAENEGN